MRFGVFDDMGLPSSALLVVVQSDVSIQCVEVRSRVLER